MNQAASGGSPLIMRNFGLAVIVTSFGLARFVTAAVNDREKRMLIHNLIQLLNLLPRILVILFWRDVAIPSGSGQ